MIRRYPLLSLAVVAMAATALTAWTGSAELSRIIAVTAIVISVIWIVVDMVRELLHRRYGLDVLALVAIVACVLVDEYLAALIIVLMLSGGEALEDYAQRRATRELAGLLDQSPRQAHLIDSGPSGSLHDVDVDSVQVGDTILVRSNELVPVDGQLLTASASFDLSSLTGESHPVRYEAGAEILSGSINQSHAVHLRVVRRAENSGYQQIVELVRQAKDSKAPVVRLADRFAMPFTVLSLLIAATAWGLSGDPVRFAEVLVLATPCPLLIAVPVAFLGGMSRASKAGMVVKGGAVVEQLAKVRSVAFDKTGTLTTGAPKLVGIHPAGSQFTAEQLLQWAASAEQYSTHVLAESITRELKSRGMALRPAVEAEEVATNGVSAVVDGRRVVVGKPSYIQAIDPSMQQIYLAPGQSAAYIAVDEAYAGALMMEDAPRPEASSVLLWLRHNGVATQIMLTGDIAPTAQNLADQVGIKQVHAQLQPSQKVELLQGITARPLMMVGDGTNDAPALASADIGIAMGAKSSTAAGAAADAVILRDSLAPIPQVIAISRHTVAVALRAIWIGLSLSVGLMLIATTGAIPAVVGALLQEVVDLVTILYALRTLRGPKPVVFPGTAEAAKERIGSTA